MYSLSNAVRLIELYSAAFVLLKPQGKFTHMRKWGALSKDVGHSF